MLAQLLLMVICTLLLLIATAMTIKNADHDTIEDLYKPTDSRSSILRHLAEEKEEQKILVDLATEKLSSGPLEPCLCSADNVKKTLA